MFFRRVVPHKLQDQCSNDDKRAAEDVVVLDVFTQEEVCQGDTYHHREVGAEGDRGHGQVLQCFVERERIQEAGDESETEEHGNERRRNVRYFFNERDFDERGDEEEHHHRHGGTCQNHELRIHVMQVFSEGDASAAEGKARSQKKNISGLQLQSFGESAKTDSHYSHEDDDRGEEMEPGKGFLHEECSQEQEKYHLCRGEEHGIQSCSVVQSKEPQEGSYDAVENSHEDQWQDHRLLHVNNFPDGRDCSKKEEGEEDGERFAHEDEREGSEPLCENLRKHVVCSRGQDIHTQSGPSDHKGGRRVLL